MQKKNPLKIGVDLRPLLGKKVSGVETYITQVLTHVLKEDDFNQYYFWVNAAKDFSFPKELKAKNVKFLQSKWPNKFLNFSSAFLGFPDYQKFFPEKLDLFWVMDPRPVVFKNTPIITTFHDLSPVKLPQFFNAKTRFWHRMINLKKLAEKSAKIIAVSESTKKDLISEFEIEENKIEVIYEAAADGLRSVKKSEVNALREKYNLPEKYVLTLSTLEPRKNLIRLIEAFKTTKAMLKTENSLVVAGVTNESIFAKMPEMKKEKDVIFTGFIPEKDKAALYTGADFFVYVSTLEGFGLPVAEALSCNKACLVSDNSSLPEVVGKAGEKVDPFRVSSITSGLRSLFKNRDKIKKLEKEAVKQKKNFSWKKTAKETLKFFEKINDDV